MLRIKMEEHLGATLANRQGGKKNYRPVVRQAGHRIDREVISPFLRRLFFVSLTVVFGWDFAYDTHAFLGTWNFQPAGRGGEMPSVSDGHSLGESGAG